MIRQDFTDSIAAHIKSGSRSIAMSYIRDHEYLADVNNFEKLTKAEIKAFKKQLAAPTSK